MHNIDDVGRQWAIDEVDQWTETIHRVSPIEFNEEHRYIHIGPMQGAMRFKVNPYMREIINCAAPESPIREINLMKGVQITYSTLLDSIMLYYIGEIQTDPLMYITADDELAKQRIDVNIIPMLHQSGFKDRIRSADEGNSRKTGLTKKLIQWAGGGVLYPLGAQNPNKMRQNSAKVLFKDEIDGWPITVGRQGSEGCPDKLTDGRAAAYYESRKIFRGSTPKLKDTSKIYKNYLKGDQRKYMVLCISCSYPQELVWHKSNKETGEVYGVDWEMQDGTVIPESVVYRCKNCGHGHVEADKLILFSEEHGAHWKPTARPIDPFIRSYHLPSMYSPYGFKSWAGMITDYIEAYDPDTGRTKDIEALQTFYNLGLGEPFEERGSKVRFQDVSGHRRLAYKYGQIPNYYAQEHSGSSILMLTMTIDVHNKNLAVAVMGWTKNFNSYLIDYWRLEDENCTDPNSPVWGKVRALIEEKTYTADDGKHYRISYTFIDAGFETDIIVGFCAQYASNVYPILGRHELAKTMQLTKRFTMTDTPLGTKFVQVRVDAYKDRIAPVLRRDNWYEGLKQQDIYHFNAPLDTTDKQLKELTKEVRRMKQDNRGNQTYEWHRLGGNAPNELWDLLVYGHCAVEFAAWRVMTQYFQLEKVDMKVFFSYIEKNKLYFTEKTVVSKDSEATTE